MLDELPEDRHKQGPLALKWLAVCNTVQMQWRRALTSIVDRARLIARKISRTWGGNRWEKV